MASECINLGPATHRLKFSDSSAEPLSINRQQLETPFAPLFDDSLVLSAPDVSTNSAAQPDNSPTVDTPDSTTTTVANDAPPMESPTMMA